MELVFRLMCVFKSVFSLKSVCNSCFAKYYSRIFLEEIATHNHCIGSLPRNDWITTQPLDHFNTMIKSLVCTRMSTNFIPRYKD